MRITFEWSNLKKISEDAMKYLRLKFSAHKTVKAKDLRLHNAWSLCRMQEEWNKQENNRQEKSINLRVNVLPDCLVGSWRLWIFVGFYHHNYESGMEIHWKKINHKMRGSDLRIKVITLAVVLRILFGTRWSITFLLQ